MQKITKMRDEDKVFSRVRERKSAKRVHRLVKHAKQHRHELDALGITFSAACTRLPHYR